MLGQTTLAAQDQSANAAHIAVQLRTPAAMTVIAFEHTLAVSGTTIAVAQRQARHKQDWHGEHP